MMFKRCKHKRVSFHTVRKVEFGSSSILGYCIDCGKDVRVNVGPLNWNQHEGIENLVGDILEAKGWKPVEVDDKIVRVKE